MAVSTMNAVAVQRARPLWRGGGGGGSKVDGNRRRSVATLSVQGGVDAGSVKIAPNPTKIGKSDVTIQSRIGLGIWSWGNTSFWNDSDWDDAKRAAAKETFRAASAAGVDFWDTAEAYDYPQGVESSEKMLGEFIAGEGDALPVKPVITTKFAPLPFKSGPEAVEKALRSSNEKMGVECTDLYLIHWPFLGREDHIEGLARCYEKGLCKAVGVSNYSADQLRDAHSQLAARGVPLAAAQNQYSLLWQNPENNGLLKACEDLDITLMAYSPLCQGLLTGKYDSNNLPVGPRGRIFKPLAEEMDPLLTMMREIGEANGGKTPTQVALNWLLATSPVVVPIPGANRPAHAEAVAGAVDWEMDAQDVQRLRETARQVRAAAVGKNAFGGLIEGFLKNV